MIFLFALLSALMGGVIGGWTGFFTMAAFEMFHLYIMTAGGKI